MLAGNLCLVRLNLLQKNRLFLSIHLFLCSPVKFTLECVWFARITHNEIHLPVIILH